VGGSGGSYGGAGGRGRNGTGTAFSPTSAPYGSHTLDALFGGSGGGGGTHVKSEGYYAGSGGGGGGAIGLFALRTITIAGTLDVSGGEGYGERTGGGGGSGGGVLLAARQVELSGAVTAGGGAGGDAHIPGFSYDEHGGGGGGGRVAIYSQDEWGVTMEAPYTNAPAGIVISGGIAAVETGSEPQAHDGDRGTFYAGEAPRWTEPRSSVLILR
jgi:hypothetical protein